MKRQANTQAEYLAALEALDNEPIIGEHVIGRLEISVNHKRWQLRDRGYLIYSGKATTGAGLRLGIAKTVTKCVRDIR